MISQTVIRRQAGQQGTLSQIDSYYQDNRDDYYARADQPSCWHGQLATALDLQGSVNKADFMGLMQGVHHGLSLRDNSARRQDNHERLGLDLTFNAPKSISLQALIGDDQRLIHAHDAAVAETLCFIEQHAETRKKINGQSQVELTGKLAIATFRHDTNREQEPHLHTHAIVLNFTQRQDGQYRALHNEKIIKAIKEFSAFYQASLARKASDLGYTIRLNANRTFDLAHISPEHIKQFSSRSRLIEQQLAQQGLNRQTASSQQKQQATLFTRKRKMPLDKAQVRQDWLAQALELNIELVAPPAQSVLANYQLINGQTSIGKWQDNAGKLLKPALSPLQRVELSEKELLQQVIAHVTEKKVETTRQELLVQTLQQGLGLINANQVNAILDRAEQQGEIVYLQSRFRPAASIDESQNRLYTEWQTFLQKNNPELGMPQSSELLNQLIQKGRLVETEKIYTTPVHLQREQEILQQLSNGRTTGKILAGPALGQKLAQTSLNPEQKQAVSHILSTEQPIVGIQGYAGTGKSFMLNSAIALATEQQKDVVLLAPYGAQVKSLKDDGMDASTLASFLNSPKRQDAIAKDSVVIVDESGVVNTRQMHQLLKIAEQQQAKVVLLGDVAQTKAVDAGSPFKLMQQHGMPTVTLSNIQRQKEPELKKAVVEAAYHRPEQSLKHLKHIAQIKDRHQRHEMIAEQYSQLSEDERKNTIVVSGRNIDRQDINQRIRDKLHLTGTGIQVDQLKRTQNTAAELTAVRTYKPGQYIEFVREPKNKQFSKGESYVIDQVDDRFIYVTDNTGKAQAINPKQQALNLYDKDKIELSHNDIIRVMQGEKEKDITTGDILKVIKATEKQIIGEDNKGNQHSFDSGKPLHLDHAYAMTVHSSQGLTVDRVIVNMDTKSRTTNKDVFYVAVSRARHEAYIYTDDNQQLPSAIRRESHKYNAHELMKKQHDNEMENLFKHDYGRH